MVNVDYSIGKLLQKILGQDLHVSGQNDHVNLVLGEEFQLFGFLLSLCVGCNGQEMIWDIELIRNGSTLVVITYDERDFHIQFLGFEEFPQTMIVFRH